jgi:CRP/FNR family transcriptional regulator, cyclic AMP receptor protein
MTSSFDTGMYATQTRPLTGEKEFHYLQQDLEKGDILYHLGEPAEQVFCVEEGLLKQTILLADGHERIIALAGPGDYIGALGLPVHYQDSAEALSPQVRVSCIDVRDLRSLDETLKDTLYLAAGKQLSYLRDALEDSELPVGARLARMFLRLGQRFGNVSDDHVHITLPLTHENFASMVGAARETTTAMLSEMRAEGVIHGTRGRYNFDHNALSDYAVNASYHY